MVGLYSFFPIVSLDGGLQSSISFLLLNCEALSLIGKALSHLTLTLLYLIEAGIEADVEDLS